MQKSFFINREKRMKGNLLAILSGILLVLCFPGFSMDRLAWIALVPLLMTSGTESLLRTFKSGFLCGVVFFAGALYWVTNTMVTYGHLNIVFSYAILLLLVFYLSLYFAIFSCLLSSISAGNPLRKWVCAPALWVSLEFVRGWLLTGFPWVLLGYSQSREVAIIQIADITGVYGVSFLIVLVNSTIVYIFESSLRVRVKIASSYRKKIQTNRMPILIMLMIISLSYFYGMLRIEALDTFAKDSLPISVKIAQGNIDQDKKWDKQYQNEVFQAYSNLTTEEGKEGKETPELIVWPETATPFFYGANKQYTKMMDDLVADSGSFLFFGSPRYIYDKAGEPKMFNSAYLLSAKKGVEGVYDKQHLVPFGEYIPFSKVLWFVNKMVEGIGEFISGEEFTVFSLPKYKFSSLICFEVIFPDLARQFVKGGADFLINITNDAWFGKSAASAQHLSMVVFRAVENRVPVVRAANTGISAFVSSSGELLAETDLFVRTTLTQSIYPKTGTNSFYTTYGDLFALFCFIFTAIVGFLMKLS